MGNGRDVSDAGHHDPYGLKRANGRLPTGAWPLDIDFDLSEPVLHAPARYPFGGTLGGKGRSLSGSLESNRSRTPGGDNVSFRIRQGDYRIVEGRLDVSAPLGNGLALPFTWSGLSSCHRGLLLLPGGLSAPTGHGLLAATLGPGVGLGPLSVCR